MNHIAKWDGTEWSALGASFAGMDGYVRALAVYDDGSGEALYAGGINIRKWDGTEWSGPSGSPKSNRDAVTGSPWQDTPPTWFALAVYDDGNGEALYAGGEYGYLKKWDGVEWRHLFQADSSIDALAVLDDGRGEALYAGGLFNSIGGVTVNHIARWDGAEWSALAGPSEIGVASTIAIFGFVSAITDYDDGSGKALWAGGNFTTAGGVVSSRIAKWSCPPEPAPRPRSGATRLPPP